MGSSLETQEGEVNHETNKGLNKTSARFMSFSG